MLFIQVLLEHLFPVLCILGVDLLGPGIICVSKSLGSQRTVSAAAARATRGLQFPPLSLQSSCRASRNTVSGYFLAGRDMTWGPVSAPCLLPPLLPVGPHLISRSALICIPAVTMCVLLTQCHPPGQPKQAVMGQAETDRGSPSWGAGKRGKGGARSRGGPLARSFSSLSSRWEPPSLPAARARASSSDWRVRVQLEAWRWQASSGM